MLYITYPLSALLMMAIGVGWGISLTRRFGLGWRLYWIGAATFVASQVVHIPLNMLLTLLFQRNILPAPPQEWQLIFNAIVLGLSAGICEEGSRYLTYRWWAKDARSWGKGLLLGAGHGGIEAILLGGFVLLTFIQMVALRDVDLATVVPADKLALAQEQMIVYWSPTWYDSLLGTVERFFTLPLHLACSVLVLQTFTRQRRYWLPLAIGWHALVDGLAVVIYATWGAYPVEAAVGGLALVSVAIILALRQPEPEMLAELDLPLPTISIDTLEPIDTTDENLEDTKYA
ncbi:MAG: YhfC family intramembrane metalloprotease [Anaerolineae bacterium]|nr:YhfC family intramembrane metalloprotease [Anaerolineae bacterium]